MAARYSTAAVIMGHNALTRTIRHAEARDRVGRNVATLVDTPKGQAGRPSKSLTLAQAEALMAASKDSRLHAYIALCLSTGIRTEEARELRWDHLDLDGNPDADPPHPRERCRLALRAGPRGRQDREVAPDPDAVQARRHSAPGAPAARRIRRSARRAAGGRTTAWCSPRGTEPRSTRPTSAGSSRRSASWPESARTGHPRELRHSFVSLMSASGVPVEEICASESRAGLAHAR